MTRHQQRLNDRFRRAQERHFATLTSESLSAALSARDALIGDALYRRNQSRITPTARSVRDHGAYATARQMARAGVDFVDCYCSVFGQMPKGVWK